jgi:hypothetical protein
MKIRIHQERTTQSGISPFPAETQIGYGSPSFKMEAKSYTDALQEN